MLGRYYNIISKTGNTGKKQRHILVTIYKWFACLKNTCYYTITTMQILTRGQKLQRYFKLNRKNVQNSNEFSSFNTYTRGFYFLVILYCNFVFNLQHDMHFILGFLFYKSV